MEKRVRIGTQWGQTHSLTRSEWPWKVRTCPPEGTGPGILLRPFTKNRLPSQAGYWQTVSTDALPPPHHQIYEFDICNYRFAAHCEFNNFPWRGQSKPFLVTRACHSGEGEGVWLSCTEWHQKVQQSEVLPKEHWRRIRLRRNQVANPSPWCKNKSPFVNAT